MKVEESGVSHGPTNGRDDATDLFARNANAIYRYCLRRLGSPEEAEDALQVTYLNAWRSLKAGCEPKEGRAWLFQIASNVCSGVLRSKLGGTRLELRDPSALDELFAVEDPDSDELVGLSEVLRGLPSRQRRALLLRDWRGLSYNEIAAEMAVSAAAVETLLFRARKTVAVALANAEWRRKLAPSARALLVWPFGLMRTKAAATAGAGHLKLGLALAGGTVAPLVAFGVIQAVFLGPGGQMAQANGGPAVAQRTPIEASGPWLADGRLPHAASAPARTRSGRGATTSRDDTAERRTRSRTPPKSRTLPLTGRWPRRRPRAQRTNRRSFSATARIPRRTPASRSKSTSTRYAGLATTSAKRAGSAPRPDVDSGSPRGRAYQWSMPSSLRISDY